jgi:hypothetical protein
MVAMLAHELIAMGCSIALTRDLEAVGERHRSSP